MLSDRPVGVGNLRVWLADHHRTPLVSAAHHVRVERDCPQKWNRQLLAHPLTAAPAKDVGGLTAMRTGKPAHVFDNPEDWHIHLFEHPQSASGHVQAHILWSGNDHCSR